MNKIIVSTTIFAAVLLSPITLFGQNDCRLETDTFHFSNFYLYSEGHYSFMMSGVSKRKISWNKKYRNKNDFIKCFYKDHTYAQRPANGFRQALERCQVEDFDQEKLKDIPYVENTIDFDIFKTAHVTRIRLKSGDRVIIKTTKLAGRFWKFRGTDIQNQWTNSTEYILKNYSIEVDECIVPFDVIPL